LGLSHFFEAALVFLPVKGGFAGVQPTFLHLFSDEGGFVEVEDRRYRCPPMKGSLTGVEGLSLSFSSCWHVLVRPNI
jgi:hypothetical protein